MKKKIAAVAAAVGLATLAVTGVASASHQPAPAPAAQSYETGAVSASHQPAPAPAAHAGLVGSPKPAPAAPAA